jgi:hypothetical protein
MNEKKILIGIILATIIGIAIWMFFETKPRVGMKQEDLGRTHVPVGTQTEYKSNPPTSGPHYEDWVKSGIFDRPQDDRYLVHALEHGYIIMSYNCSIKTSFIPNLIKDVFAQGMESTQSAAVAEIKTAKEDASASAKMGPEFSSDECKKLVDDLSAIYNSKGPKKLIVVPRPSLDAKIALTAWLYSDKFDSFDKGRIEKFIDSNRDRGPEKTME